jgi:hypothetical protein
MIRLSKFANLVKPSATLAIAAKAKQMKAQGLPVFDFSLGEPDSRRRYARTPRGRRQTLCAVPQVECAR